MSYEFTKLSEVPAVSEFPEGANAIIETNGEIKRCPSSGGSSVPKPLTYDYMPEGYPSKSVQTATLMEEQEIAFASEGEGVYGAPLTNALEIVEGQTYTVKWDGTEYECVCHASSSMHILGNLSIIGAGDDTGEPFIYLNVPSVASEFETMDTAASHTISVKKTGEIATPMAEEFLPIASKDNYGAVKKSEIVTSYKFDRQAPHDQMVDAITAFKTGNASIVWAGRKVIDAKYNSSDDTISVIFANDPLNTQTFSNTNGFYIYNLGSSTYGELQGRLVRIFNGNNSNVYATLMAKGEFPNVTLSTDASRIAINGICGMSTTEIILKSSTEGSSKNFKITVDDSGTLSATEVTA